VTRPVLQSDCSQCFGLCCVLLPFSAVSGFGVDKPGGRPCLNLLSDDSCRIHATLREDGWPGCTVFECFGAGQQVSQVTYGGVSWRGHDNLGEMAAVLSVMRQLHEMLLHLAEVARRGTTERATRQAAEITALTAAPPEELLTVDLEDLRARVGTTLEAASARIRGDGTSFRGQDLAGRDLRGLGLRDADLRGAVLIAADARAEELGRADLLGADVRDTDVRGTDLGRTLFLTQAQLNTARGDRRTTIPEGLRRPAHWR
jgi:uncharacterized protein YjbI with pentapeptide repeats